MSLKFMFTIVMKDVAGPSYEEAGEYHGHRFFVADIAEAWCSRTLSHYSSCSARTTITLLASHCLKTYPFARFNTISLNRNPWCDVPYGQRMDSQVNVCWREGCM